MQLRTNTVVGTIKPHACAQARWPQLSLILSISSIHISIIRARRTTSAGRASGLPGFARFSVFGVVAVAQAHYPIGVRKHANVFELDSLFGNGCWYALRLCHRARRMGMSNALCESWDGASPCVASNTRSNGRCNSRPVAVAPCRVQGSTSHG